MGGAVEEGGKVATSLVDAMKSQPLAVALVVVNLMFLATAGYFLHDLAGAATAKDARKDELITKMIANQEVAVELLSRCIVPPSGK